VFEDLNEEEAVYVYRGLRALIESNSGIGFHNMDQGHPFYRFGANGKTIPGPDRHEESPEVNALYNMLSSLCDRLEREGRAGDTWFYDFRGWPNYCRFAVESHDRARGAGEGR
jgi:hypothetical protein